ncbi:hypothetical protein DESC_610255 [Desulfosarcina cetonica]|nr:hypothetical protein DESC_610255 [Desulfosarcina cetonica]
MCYIVVQTIGVFKMEQMINSETASARPVSINVETRWRHENQIIRVHDVNVVMDACGNRVRALFFRYAEPLCLV